MTPINPMAVTRRHFLSLASLGMGSAALAALLPRSVQGAEPRVGGLPGLPHFEPKAKRVIYLYMAGGPSHLETFDFKPNLAEMHGKPMPESFGKVVTAMGTSNNTIMPQSVLFKPEYATKWANYDPALANKLLDEAGLSKRNAEGIRLLPGRSYPAGPDSEASVA